MNFKRILSIILAALMLTGALGLASEGRARYEGDVWEAIDRLEDAALAQTDAADARHAAAADYAALTDEVIALVTGRRDYKPGSLSRNGYFFNWEDLSGEVYGYSPSLRAKIRSAVPAHAGDTEAVDGVSVVSEPLSEQVNGPRSADVAVFQPYYGLDTSFTKRYANEGKAIASALGGQCTVYVKNAATIDALAEAVASCGVVIFDSHGDTDYAGPNEDYTSRANTSYMLLQTGTGLTAADKAEVMGPYGGYRHAYFAGSYGNMKYWAVDGTAIANHMNKDEADPELNNMIWIAICLGMATDGLEKPLREKGAGVVYGYSQSVTFDGDYAWEAVFWKQMREEGATVAEAIALMKERVGCPDPYTDYDRAYPIVVSDVDPYPGKGRVDRPQQVYSDWKLEYQGSVNHKLTVTVNDQTMGSVEVGDNFIKPVPNEGYRVESCEITKGEGTLAETDGGYLITMQSDCTVEVTFGIEAYFIVRYATPNGTEIPETVCYDKTFTVPGADGMSNGIDQRYRFIGWCTSPMQDAAGEQTYFGPGATVSLIPVEPNCIITLYALYEHEEDGRTLYTTDPPSTPCEHVYIAASEIPAGCETAGEIRYVCELCGDEYTETTEPLGHDWDAPGYFWMADRSVCVGLAVCLRDRTHSINEQAAATSAITREPTYFEPGETTYTAEFTVYPFTTQTLTEAIPAKELPCGGEGDCPGSVFTDMPKKGHWAHDAIDWALVHKITAGTTATTFSPNAGCTRAQVVTFLWKAAGSPEPGETTNRFVDVKKGAYYEKAVLWAVEKGITAGTDDTHFGPGNTCTRAQIVTFLWRFEDSPEPGTNDVPFTDVGERAYYRKAVAWATENGITGGIGGGLFGSGNTCTRAQIVTFLYKDLVR